MRLEVRHLEVLLAIEACGSISGAARKLGVDQPHLTRQLRRIEQRLDISVFLRTARGVIPTDAGLRVLALARTALGIIDDLAVDPDDDMFSNCSRLTLRVLYHGVPAVAILDELGTTHPDLQVRFSTAAPREAFDQLRAGTADVFLGIWLPHVDWPDAGALAATEILADPTYVYLAADHPLADTTELNLADLATENWISGVSEDGTQMVGRECRLVGGFDPCIGHRVGDETAVSTLLSRGRGVMLGSSVAAPRPGVVGRPYRGSSPARWMQVHTPGQVDRDLVADLATLLRRLHDRWSESMRRHVLPGGNSSTGTQNRGPVEVRL